MIQPMPVSMIAARPRSRQRTVLIASADGSFRERLNMTLSGLRWQVREAQGGAHAWTEAETAQPEALIVDSWLPDLDLNEFLSDFRQRFPQVDMVASGSDFAEGPRGPYRQELLYALRRIQENDTSAWNTAKFPPQSESAEHVNEAPSLISIDAAKPTAIAPTLVRLAESVGSVTSGSQGSARSGNPGAAQVKLSERLPELVGDAPCMLEVSRRIRLVAQRPTPVLIEGPTGSGKELVAEALHRLSSRSRKPFVAINCAAIPEALLEAELFGHTRGAFTGAVQGRVGRIEAADGGTLFLDEIGEMPLALQSKLLRFVECGELQRVGDNETVKVDVRIVAATHRQLCQQAASGGFRSDLYYRLAVFLIRTPSLAAHTEDLPTLVEHFLEKLGREMPIKRADASAMAKLAGHSWPGNVRELEHVLERAVILAGDEPVLTAHDIDFGLDVN
jgi:DNA-binding NtrC family response regulator